MRDSLVAFLACMAVAHAASFTVGGGAPTAQIRDSFVAAYGRGQPPFSNLAPNPTSDVKPLAAGYVQEFQATGDNPVTFALVDPFLSPGLLDTRQMYSDLYLYFIQLGVATTGFPAIDTAGCPSNTFGTCNYQIFTNDYALVVYSSPVGLKFAIRDPFYIEWNNAGGIAGTFGVATGAETAVTSISEVRGTEQTYATGAIFAYPLGATAPVIYGVSGVFYTLFNSAGGFAVVGFPTSEAARVNTAGLIRQTFESARIEQMPGSDPSVLFPISLVDIVLSGQGLNLSPGAASTVSAAVTDTQGNPVTGRILTWSTSNGNVATVQGNGYGATVTGVGPGTANIYVTGEGKTSPPLLVTVGSACCSVGQGAPTAAITQAFQLALARGLLSTALTASAQVVRVGTGYVQLFTGSDGSAYAIAEPDGSGVAYVLTGSIYAEYLALGGYTGSLGYPVSDPLPGGAQKFSSGAALAGMPIRLIPAAIAAKWFQSGGPINGVGVPIADATFFSTPNGSSGTFQIFANGAIFGITGGPSSGQTFLSKGPILARYLALNGPAGALGLPLTDIYTNGGAQAENFETGYIDLQPGAEVAVEHFNPRYPAVSTIPGTVAPGGRVHILASGFAPSATLNFSITGQAGFSTSTPAGAFAWDVLIPPAMKPSTITVRVTAVGASDTASASYSIVSVEALLPKLSITSGDRQTGLPGSILAAPVVASLVDESGNPLGGVPIFWSASPEAAIQSTPITDSTGRAAGYLRLPPSSGVAVGSVSAGGQIANFSALGAAKTFLDFPSLAPAADSRSGLVAALAALVRYYQTTGTLGEPNGLATPAALNSFLAENSGLFPSESGNQFPNPWVAARFAASGIWLEPTTPNGVRDLLGAGFPLTLVLNVTVDGQAGGSAAVDAVGVDDLGSIVIEDPNPAFSQTTLSGYLNGFVAQGHNIRGVLVAVIRMGATTASTGSFVIASPLSGGVSLSSVAGACAIIDLLDPASAKSVGPPGGARFEFCDGTQPIYQLDFSSPGAALAVDLNNGAPLQIPATGTLSWRIARDNGALIASPQTLAIAGVTDSAAFGPLVSPGGLISIFGSGFVTGSGMPSVMLAGDTIPVLAARPFQLNAILPATAATGTARLQVSGALGLSASNITISPVSPGIFMLAANNAGLPQGAVVNQDGSINGPAAPAQRGQYISIYCAGLGLTEPMNGFQSTTTPTSVVVNGVSLTPSFVGLLPGFTGLYQINVTVPASLAPGLNGSLEVIEASQRSNAVEFSLQ